MRAFREGMPVEAIFFKDEAFHKVGDTCKSITVSMECGQMSGVPWFEVRDHDDKITLWNGALLEGVEL